MPSVSILPAFPELHAAIDDDFGGMTKREWFAGHALNGLLASGTFTNSGDGFEDFIANKAVNIADAMLSALEVKP